MLTDVRLAWVDMQLCGRPPALVDKWNQFADPLLIGRIAGEFSLQPLFFTPRLDVKEDEQNDRVPIVSQP